MYLDFIVEIPDVPGKIVKLTKKGTTYIDYEYDRIYDKKNKYTRPRRSTIGKLSNENEGMMIPNQNFLKFFPDVELPEENNRVSRSSCLKLGAYIVIKKIVSDYKLMDILTNYFEEKDARLFLDIACYSIITENNAGQYYPMYAYNHPLFTENMKIYSDAKVSEFLNSIDESQSIDFLNEWNENRSYRERIYLSYDATNKNCQAGDIEMVEYGKAKIDTGNPIFNYSIAYDSDNREPLFYEKYPGSINDISQLEYMIDKVKGYGYKKIGFILDRGYFSKSNIKRMDKEKYDFVIMVKGMSSLINELILKEKGSFENDRKCNIYEYGVYGKTIRRKLYESDEKERYFHIYHSITKESIERASIEKKIRDMTDYLKSMQNKQREFGEGFKKYFELYYDNEEKGLFLLGSEKAEVIEKELKTCGYFCIITSRKMSAKEAIRLYKSRDASEKLFRGDKTYLGNKSIRVYSDESASAKIFIEFVALIIRSKIYTCLKDEMLNQGKKYNYMTVPAAIRELEKIELIRQTDNVYRLDHAVTAVQKNILKAFGLDVAYVKYVAKEVSECLRMKKGENKDVKN